MGVSVNGIAHIQLSVSDPGRCLPFWEKLCNFLDMPTLIKGEDVLYCVEVNFVPGRGHFGAGGRLGPGGRGPAGGYGAGGISTD